MQLCCSQCAYWNHNIIKPKCNVLGRCNPNSQYCDYTMDEEQGNIMDKIILENINSKLSVPQEIVEIIYNKAKVYFEK